MRILGLGPGVRQFWSKSTHSWLAAILFCCPGPVDHFSFKWPRFWTLSMDTNWLDMLSCRVIFLFCGPPAKSLLIVKTFKFKNAILEIAFRAKPI